MNDQERTELTERSNSIRLELKVWEKQFAAANNGQKASRDDIKQNPEIAAKYKEYNKSRDILSGKISQHPKQPKNQTPKKRKRENVTGHGISKRQQLNKTPSKIPTKGSMQPWEVDPYESPSLIRNLFTPSKKALGPTPQKDGVVLGLFDLLEEEANIKPDTTAPIQATPRKPRGGGTETSKYSRTPGSSGKRFMLNAFATPLKNRESNGQGGKTPLSVSKIYFPTPSFLRRDSQRINLHTVNEDPETLELSPQMVRVPRKPLVRGLSSILAGLRKMESDAADEDLEALREMEAEEEGGPSNPISKPKPQLPRAPPESALEPDTQPNFPLGGFDDEATLDSEPEDTHALDRDGQPLKVYKKKGQKRTTRRVNMKPVRSKPRTSQQPTPPDDEDSADELATDPIAIPETQIDDAAEFSDARNFESEDTQSEYTASEGGTRYRRPNQGKKTKSANKHGRVKTAARKVGALAHQNFKRLKLRNSGAKGGPGHGSRFRRKK